MDEHVRNFIEERVEADIQAAGPDYTVCTRFPPEPNGYLHIGHVRAISINFGIKEKYNGRCNLRMDDTNPAKEDMSYVEAIKRDIAWLGYEWDRLTFGSDYYEQTYNYAVELIKKGLAYVCDLSPEQIREYRGTLTQPGKNSPYRERSVEENLQLFEKMKNGEFPDGACVLRAKIDMSSPNMNMRDPVIYRICRMEHYRTGDKWIIYPMYDFAHPIQDALEGVTHSLCSFEFEDHRPLYNWVIEHVSVPGRPQQIEFARMNITRTVMSKRYLKRLVESGVVSGWDDPRMPTIAGLRRRGYTPSALRDFCARTGVAKSVSMIDSALLEHCVREDLNEKSLRRMAVIHPLKLVITNYPEDKKEYVSIENHNLKPELGTRSIAFTRELYIEQEDFMENPPGKFFRLAPGREVRLKGAYIIKCERAVKDENGDILYVECTYDPDTLSGMPGSERKVKGTLHWLSALECAPAQFRLYDYLLDDRDGEDIDFSERLNENSLVIANGYIEPALAQAQAGESFQFVRMGYFRKDEDSTAELSVFNRIVGLKDSWAKAAKK
ncbi:MAG TPA: glutamine--tRNA ligase/YqeY domain fusion protein [Firmicutes bacterium]|nr:glutamine--tRNA ligase/YqeY domain fusion protein [Bacillota bacterium]